MACALYDTVVIGAGPAGASCAVWLAQLGFSPLVVESSPRIGGLVALNPFNDAWNVIAPSLTGSEIAHNIKVSLDASRVPVLLDTRVKGVQRITTDLDTLLPQLEPKTALPPSALPYIYRIDFTDESFVYARFVVLATGVKPRTAPELQGHTYPDILVGPGKIISQYEFALRNVAILGGGDNAFENALYIQKMAAKNITIYARHLRAQKQWLNLIHPDQLHIGPYQWQPEVMQVNGQTYDTIVVLYGWEAQLLGLDQLGLALDHDGFIAVDFKTTETNIPGIFAIGEVTKRSHPCVVSSLADGVAAAKAIQFRLESSGVDHLS